jgi:LmbE family N-acetylglucosaminyl deacetylase
MSLLVDADHLGTPESTWIDSGRLAHVAPLEWTDVRRIVVVSPHPDDEVFGVGGLLQLARDRGIPIEIVAVTDGERSHPDPAFDLGEVRAMETGEALKRLGLGCPPRRRLGIPDGDVAAHSDALADRLTESLRPHDLCIAPWGRDGHPDHDACGQAALAASLTTEVRLIGFLVWAWHWAHPDGADLPWDACRRVELPPRFAARKRWAARSFVTQTHPLGPPSTPTIVLPPSVLRRFYRPFEIFIEGD